jgi:hypothetical protein
VGIDSPITLHPVMLVLGALLPVIPCLSLLASANKQNWVGTTPWLATAVVLNEC